MKLIIDIPKEEYKMRILWAKSDNLCSPDTMLIAKGVPYEERPQGELISREALKKAIDHLQYTDDFCVKHQIDNSISLYMLEKIIDNAPTVEERYKEKYDQLKEAYSLLAEAYEHEVTKEERAQGKWVDYSEEGFIECPFCHKATTCEDNIDELHFCWNCGAEMKGGEEE